MLARKTSFLLPLLLAAPGAAQTALVVPFDAGLHGVARGGQFAVGSDGFLASETFVVSLEDFTRIPAPGVQPRFVSDDGMVVLGLRRILDRATGVVSDLPGPIVTPAGAGLSADGQRVLLSSGDQPTAARVWNRSTGAITTMSSAPTATRTLAYACSADASRVVGVEYLPNMRIRPVLWDGTTGARTYIDPAVTHYQGFATTISDDGTWVGGMAVIWPTLDELIFRWSAATGIEYLGFPAVAPSGFPGFPLWIANDGRTLICRASQQISPEAAWIWEEGARGKPLNQWLAERGEAPVSSDATFQGADADGTRMAFYDFGAPVAGFLLEPDALVSTAECSPAPTNSTGRPASLALLGRDAAASDALFLEARDAPPGQSILPFVGPDAALVPGAGGSAGVLCVGGGIGRFPVGATTADGRYVARLDLTALPRPTGTVAAMAGQTWRFQAWFRDPGTGGSNMTDVAAITLQ